MANKLSLAGKTKAFDDLFQSSDKELNTAGQVIELNINLLNLFQTTPLSYMKVIG